jgi:hypothetical protein
VGGFSQNNEHLLGYSPLEIEVYIQLKTRLDLHAVAVLVFSAIDVESGSGRILPSTHTVCYLNTGL